MIERLFDLDSPIITVDEAAHLLNSGHYLGAARKGFGWADEFGVLILSSPTSRRLPHDRWLELVRWCLSGEKNAGSRQWSRVRRWLVANRPDITTVVSYSDPSVGHTGALYRACNWIAAPTWHALRPPPTGMGSWDGVTRQAVKDRWIFPLRRDPEREGILRINDDGLARKFAHLEYRDPKRFR
jgi:hypothetical protein